MKKLIDFIIAIYVVFASMFMVLLVADANIIGLLYLIIPIAVYFIVDTFIVKKED